MSIKKLLSQKLNTTTKTLIKNLILGKIFLPTSEAFTLIKDILQKLRKTRNILYNYDKEAKQYTKETELGGTKSTETINIEVIHSINHSILENPESDTCTGNMREVIKLSEGIYKIKN